MTVLPSGKIGDPKERHPANATVIVGSITVRASFREVCELALWIDTLLNEQCKCWASLDGTSCVLE